MRFFRGDDERQPRRIEDNRPIVWEKVDGPNGPLYAGSQLTATPYGNVRRNIGYDVWLSSDEVDNLDFDQRLYAQTLLEMKNSNSYYSQRLKICYTEEELWPNGNKPKIITGDFSKIFNLE